MNWSGIKASSLSGRLLRLPLRLVPRNVTIPILQGPLRGSKWITGAGTNGCWLGTYEWEKQKLFVEQLGVGESVYDLGANVGFYTLLASKAVGPTGRVTAFEPAPRNLTYLKKHLALNNVSNCKIFEAAVSDSDGTASFEAGENPSSGRIRQGGGAPLMVRTVSIDSMVDSGIMVPPSLIKCDIEGGELSALRGAIRTLDRYRPTLFLATHGAVVHRECCKLLEQFYNLTPLDKPALTEATEVLAKAR